jgi:hypothetical protein
MGDTLFKDIEEDLNEIETVEDIKTFNYGALCGMYRNKQEEVVFIRAVHSVIVERILKGIRERNTARFCVLVGILHEIYICTGKHIDVEMTIENVEAINQHFHTIRKKRDSVLHKAVEYAYETWTRLKALNGLRICILPFLAHEYELIAAEEELNSIEGILQAIAGNE